MSDRFTRQDVEALASQVWPLMVSHGIVPADATMHLQAGSPTYGRAWRLHYSPAGETGHYSPSVTSCGYLGWTAREAWETLATIRRTLCAVADAVRSAS